MIENNTEVPYHKTEKHKQYLRNYYAKNKDNFKQSHQKHYAKIKGVRKYLDRNAAAGRRYYKKNKGIISANARQYYQSNKLQLNAYNKQYRKDRAAKDPQFKLRLAVRSRISTEFKKHKIKSIGRNTNRLLSLIGCSFDVMLNHIEQQWVEGMSWDNHGIRGWHVDHIKPCASFDLTCPEQLAQCFHYTNMQPLWWRDNLKKGSKTF